LYVKGGGGARKRGTKLSFLESRTPTKRQAAQSRKGRGTKNRMRWRGEREKQIREEEKILPSTNRSILPLYLLVDFPEAGGRKSSGLISENCCLRTLERERRELGENSRGPVSVKKKKKGETRRTGERGRERHQLGYELGKLLHLGEEGADEHLWTGYRRVLTSKQKGEKRRRKREDGGKNTQMGKTGGGKSEKKHDSLNPS